MRSRLRICLFFTVLALTGFASETPDSACFDPKPFGIQRYEHIWKQSPFVVETPVARKSEGLEQQYVLTGVATVNSTPVVFLLDRKSLSRLMVTSGSKANPQNVQLISVAPNPDPKLASATIRVGAEQGTIHYDPAALQTSAAPPAASKPGTQTVAAGAQAATPDAGSASSASPAPPVTVKFVRRTSPINLKP